MYNMYLFRQRKLIYYEVLFMDLLRDHQMITTLMGVLIMKSILDWQMREKQHEYCGQDVLSQPKEFMPLSRNVN